jgi:hypothetical protein
MSVIAHFGHEKRPVANAGVPPAAGAAGPRSLNIEGDRGSGIPGQRRSRTMKRASRQRAFTGLTAVSGSSPTGAAHL